MVPQKQLVQAGVLLCYRSHHLILAISCQNSPSSLTRTRPHLKELLCKRARKKVAARPWVSCSLFLSHCICLSFTCRLRRDQSLAADGQTPWDHLEADTENVLSALSSIWVGLCWHPRAPQAHRAPWDLHIFFWTSPLLILQPVSPSSRKGGPSAWHVPRGEEMESGIPDSMQQYACKTSKGQKNPCI